MTDAANILYGAAPAAAPPALQAGIGRSAADTLYAAPAAAPIASPAPQVAAAPAQAQESPPVASGKAIDPASALQVVEPAVAARQVVEAWVPEAIRAERAADVGRKMFDHDALAETITQADFADMHPELAKAVAGEVREMARDMGLGVPDVQLLRGELDRAVASPLTPEQRIANRESVVDALNRRYGTDAKQALRDARAFVAADPRRAQLLQHVGDTPNVVLRVVELARAAKTARR